MTWEHNRPGRNVPQHVRREVFERANGLCQIQWDERCTGIADCIDHILALRAGGTDHVDNLQAACKTCNGIKAGYEGRVAQGLIKVKRELVNPGLDPDVQWTPPVVLNKAQRRKG